MEQRKTESIYQFAGRVEQQFKWLQALYPGRYDRSQLKERFFQGMHPHLRDSMRFLYMKVDVGYEEFLAAVYEAETEGLEGKVLNVKAKAMTVEKINDNKEKNELKDLRQQIESLTTIMKKCYKRKCEIQSSRRDFVPQKEGSAQKNLLRKGFRGHLKGERTFEIQTEAYKVLQM